MCATRQRISAHTRCVLLLEYAVNFPLHELTWYVRLHTKHGAEQPPALCWHAGQTGSVGVPPAALEHLLHMGNPMVTCLRGL
jgi:hypothetical protein